MKKKGFTLIELVAVIVILGVLAVLVTPAIIGMRNTVVNNTLENKIQLIYDAALDYANDNIMDVPKGVGLDSDGSRRCLEDKSGIDNEDDICTSYCLLVLVKTLIDRGYLVGDSDSRTSIVNPLTGDSLNSKVVCVRYNSEDPLNREMVAYILNEDSEVWGRKKGE